MMSNKHVKDKLVSIIGSNDLDTLIGVYEQILNTVPNLSELYLEKTMNFINDINGIRSTFTEDEKEYKEQFNRDPYLVDLLKKNIQNLYSTRGNSIQRFRSNKNDGQND